MVHERDEPQARGFALDLLRHRAEREAVDQHDRAVGNRREHATARRPSAAGVGNGKLSSSSRTSTVQPRAARPATMRRSYP